MPVRDEFSRDEIAAARKAQMAEQAKLRSARQDKEAEISRKAKVQADKEQRLYGTTSPISPKSPGVSSPKKSSPMRSPAEVR